jgi:glycosyltransferase involved in cell wall biosynthesis
LRQLIPHLVSKGCNVEIVTRRWHLEMDRQGSIDGISVYRLGVPGNTRWATIVFVLSLLGFFIRNRKKIDIYHSHGAVNMGALCRVARWVTGKKNVAKIATAGRIPRLRRRLMGKLILFLFQQSDAIICMTDEIQKELVDIRTTSVAVQRITNGVNGDRFSPMPTEQKISCRRRSDIRDGDKVVLFSSRLVPRKGLDILLDAWPEIMKEYPESRLFIVGSGVDQPDSTEEQMQKKVAKENLTNVHFLGETSATEHYLGMADLFVFPSRQEGFPNALLEAMAVGLPIVATRIGGVTDIVQENETAILFESENSNDLAGRIISCLSRPDLAEKMGKLARQYVLSHYSFDSIATKYVDLYRDLVR